MNTTIKDILDGISAVMAVGVLAKLIPILYGILGIAWFCVRFYDRFVKKEDNGEE